ncbi:patatin-like phospholipase family protein [Myroides marinus]|uniref:patatin-like phospholipase family protein n=1 Tax=Myroides marinus TaxID=703342 RepID=UPI002576D209|nr:patatin-like phospholipase family protein [Myroides marinus]MDM1347161.1 patatin-like phospholipase family protein [Myroides marinus]MDM1350537.1 patatin-like phospholipase family protein [Myroides marinus]MDM1354998.1 patatin-like phospholipase family protein [Myroides marinus]MDM1357728.1 patatin-like phospholipase family protein [Myroides marinus]MDM1365179.1 patatin-like phospholipase family protein [Myroides marinus]
MRRIITVILLAICLTSNSYAAEGEKDRPKVGLVLSGGGAKGLAHIGVLKVLEEEGVKVDYIAGTSMGAIVGGLYASGYTATELDSIFNSIDVSALIKDYIPRISKSFYEKKNDEIYALTLPFDKFKIGFPKALSRGMYNYNLMNKLLAHVRHVDDFSKLKVPFLCIATNLETGEPVILKEGYLPQVILASGAFPSLFAPVEIDGKYLIDGGVVNNYPIDELRKMGADIVIGVDVQDDLKTIKEIEGAPDLLLQISNYSTIRQMKDKLPKTDVYIKPDIVGYTVVSFDEGEPIISRGVDAANKVIVDLKLLGGNKDVAKEHYVPKESDSISVSKIDIHGLNQFTRRYVHGKLGFKPNTKISFDQLADGITQLNGTENFSSMTYRFIADGEKDELDMTLVENPVNRYLKLGVHYDGLYKAAALVNVTQKNLFTKSDVASLDLALGDNVRYNFNYFIDNGFYWSVGVSSRYNQFKRDLPFSILSEASGEPIVIEGAPSMFGVDYADLENKLYFQSFYKQKYLLNIGIEHRFLDIRSKTINIPYSRFDRNHYLGGFLNVTMDTYDNRYFPRKGFLFKGEYKNFFYSSNNGNSLAYDFDNFSTITGQVGYATRITNKLAVDLRSRLGTSLGGSIPSIGFGYYLGGYGFADRDNVIPFYGYDLLSIGGNSFITGSITFDYEIFKKHHINFTANYANAGDNIFGSSDWFTRAKYTGYAVGYGMQTMIGPIEFKYTYSPDTGSTSAIFAVGFWF